MSEDKNETLVQVSEQNIRSWLLDMDRYKREPIPQYPLSLPIQVELEKQLTSRMESKEFVRAAILAELIQQLGLTHRLNDTLRNSADKTLNVLGNQGFREPYLTEVVLKKIQDAQDEASNKTLHSVLNYSKYKLQRFRSVLAGFSQETQDKVMKDFEPDPTAPSIKLTDTAASAIQDLLSQCEASKRDEILSSIQSGKDAEEISRLTGIAIVDVEILKKMSEDDRAVVVGVLSKRSRWAMFGIITTIMLCVIRVICYVMGQPGVSATIATGALAYYGGITALMGLAAYLIHWILTKYFETYKTWVESLKGWIADRISWNTALKVLAASTWIFFLAAPALAGASFVVTKGTFTWTAFCTAVNASWTASTPLDVWIGSTVNSFYAWLEMAFGGFKEFMKILISGGFTSVP